jgi:hypothetical protein
MRRGASDLLATGRLGTHRARDRRGRDSEPGLCVQSEAGAAETNGDVFALSAARPVPAEGRTREVDDMNTIKAKARRAGALYVVFLVVGLVDMYGFRHFVVAGDPAATARNIVTGELAYRIGILTDFVALLIFLPLVVSLYYLLREADKWHALLMVLLVAVGVSIGFVNLLNKLAPLVLLSGADGFSVFTRPQLEALASGFLSLNDSGNRIDAAFWGLWLLPFGSLVLKSDFFPRVLGVLLLVAGFGNLASSLAFMVLPAYEPLVSRAAMPLMLGELPMIFWLFIKGAHAPERQVAPSHVG